MSADSTSTPVEKKNFKDTLNLPKTGFSMRAGAATREPELQAWWREQGVYEASLNRRDKTKKFVLHDGPPYLSADKIHIGHALNKILKDVVTRYKYQRGYYSPYVPGYDGHGLPIENKVVKSIKGGRKAISEGELRAKCREFGKKNLDGQEENFKRLGIWGNWENPYVTTDGKFEACQIKLFANMFEKGHIYKGLKPVYWSPASETALADAEVEYADHTSHSIYVAFPFDAEGVEKGTQLSDGLKTLLADAKLVIWTTTPWTLPSNLAISVHPDFEYVLVEHAQWGKLVLAAELLDGFAKETECGCLEPIRSFKGSELELCEARHPFLSRKSVVLLGEHVTLDAGTGLVHTAPGHGMEDYTVCQQYDRALLKERPLGILSPLNNKGVFTDEVGDERLVGQFYEKANDIVLGILKENQALLGHKTFVHSYPHDWRTLTPVIYRATEQWFVSVDGFRDDALSAIQSVAWVPERGESRITSMVEGRSDWCISRQRVWGVPIPIMYDADTQEVIFDQEIINHWVGLFEEHTTDIWWTWSTEKLLEGLSSEIKTKHKLETRSVRREMDIMDVWFDSGVTHTAVVRARKEELGELPAELYLEGSDQHRGWFQSSLLTSVMLTGKAPYQQVLTHGFVLDANGRKMSKSLGNVIDPLTVINQYGADVLRLWVASVDYSVDVKIGKETIGQLVEVYKKIRNTARYLMGNLFDFDPTEHAVPVSELSLLDRHTLHRLQQVVGTLTDAFDGYSFHKYYQVLQNFCVVDLSQLYFDVAKDPLYTYPANHPERRAIQTVLYTLLTTLVPMLVPVLPHLAEDIWQNLPENQRFSDVKAAVLLDWPSVDSELVSESVAEKMNALLNVRDAVTMALETPRKAGDIGSPSETVVALQACELDLAKQLAQYGEQSLELLMLTSGVILVGAEESLPEETLYVHQEASLSVAVLKADGVKCERCRKYVGQRNQSTHGAVCIGLD